MSRKLLFSLSCLLLGACTGMPGWLPVPGDTVAPPAGATGSVPGVYRFDWRLSGARAVAPLQVFDDGQHTWLQFPDGQAWPAIFAVSAAGEQLLQPRRQGDYARLDGVWPRLRLRGGHLESLVEQWPVSTAAAVATEPDERASASPPATAVSRPATLALTPVTAQPAPAPAPVPSDAGQVRPDRPKPPALPASAAAGAEAASVRDASQPKATVLKAAMTTAPDIIPYQARLQDGTLRSVLGRWAQSSGWLFTAAHWAVDVDIPLMGEASFDPPFEQAVRALVGSTTLSTRPLRPCFYSNRVLRVIPAAQACDRSAATEHGA